MTTLSASGTFKLGDRTVHRMGYGAMQLAGPGVFGPPKDRGEAIKVLRAAVEAGVDHIDTCDYYGPHIVNQIIKEALHPYPANLVLVTKVGARRDAQGQWLPWNSPADLEQAIHDNLRNLGLDVIAAVNFRSMHGMQPTEGAIGAQVEALAELQRKGLIKHIGVSNVTPTQIREARAITPIVCVQNYYNVANRGDDAMVDALAKDGIAYVPFFPLGGFMPLQSDTLADVAKSMGATPLQTALAWLLHRSPNILLIPGTSSVAHLRENLAAADLKLPDDAMAALNGIGAKAH
ncbi:MAG TPA: aldo/keto reductase family oxidoreductase [Rhizomicrobium sp.]|jgi:aryl-alcohol dehydrogenase-like predicted oxidoreductase